MSDDDGVPAAIGVRNAKPSRFASAELSAPTDAASRKREGDRAFFSEDSPLVRSYEADETPYAVPEASWCAALRASGLAGV